MISRTVCTLALAGLPLAALAQPVGRIEPEPGANRSGPAAQPETDLRPEDGPRIYPERRTSILFTGGVVYEGATDTLGTAGDLRTIRLPASITAKIPLEDNKNIVTLGLDTTSSFYDFDAFSAFPGNGDPIDYGVEAGVSVGLIHIIDENWALNGRISTGYAGEIDAEFEDSITFGGIAGFQYTVDKDLNFGLALLLQSRLEEDTLLFPVPTFEWQATDFWNIKLGAINVGPGGVAGGLAVTYDLTEKVDVGGYVGYAFHQFRLADDNSTVPGGILEDSAVPVGAFMVYQHSPTMRIIANAKFNIYREIDLQGPGGNSIQDVELQPSLGAGVGVEIDL